MHPFFAASFSLLCMDGGGSANVQCDCKCIEGSDVMFVRTAGRFHTPSLFVLLAGLAPSFFYDAILDSWINNLNWELLSLIMMGLRL